MSNTNQKEMTIRELAEEMRTSFTSLKEYVNQGFEAMHESLNTTDETVKDIKGRLTNLEKGLFTEEEKEEILAMVRHYDKWLEDDTKGQSRITLTREEYDAASRAQGFPNRFVGVPLIDIE
jgi:molecular chaperone DnaK (HSP70)